MKSIIVAVVLSIFCAVSAFADCGGKEWELGRAIQVIPTGSTNPEDWPLWKAKLGTCEGDSVVFSQSCYFYAKPNVTDLEGCFNNQSVHVDSWHTVPEKQRTFYVFEADWQIWQKDQQAELTSRMGALSAMRYLLTRTPERQIGPGDLAYTPDDPSPTSENEGILNLDVDSWQRTYAVGEMYAQIQVRDDGAKMKFGQRINADQVKFFDVRYQIPVSGDWYPGITPFILSDMFQGYIFTDEFYPGDSSDVWTARVFVPSYKHTAWTPDNPNPAADGEGDIPLTQYTWQSGYPLGATYCQIQLRDDNTFKVKFGVIRNGFVEIFNILKNIPVPVGWQKGDIPMTLSKVFPEYAFSEGFNPDGSEIWTTQVWIPGYNL